MAIPHALQPRGGRWGDYTVVRRLGSGAQGIVYLCDPSVGAVEQHALQGRVVIKSVYVRDVPDREVRSAMQESSILSNLRHPNVVRYYDCFIDEDGCLCTVIEYCSGGDLSRVIREHRTKGDHIPVAVVSDIAMQLLGALSYLRVRRVMHRDVKPANVLVAEQGQIRLTDFGVSRLLDSLEQGAATFAGTPHYLCPEICLGERYDYASDIWALGVTLYELMALRVPFQGSNILAVVNSITDGDYPPLPAEPWTQDLREMVARMLTADPTERPSARRLAASYFPGVPRLDPAALASPPRSRERHHDISPSADPEPERPVWGRRPEPPAASPPRAAPEPSALSPALPPPPVGPLAAPTPEPPQEGPEACGTADASAGENPALGWLQFAPRCAGYDALQARIRQKAAALQRKRVLLRYKRRAAERQRQMEAGAAGAAPCSALDSEQSPETPMPPAEPAAPPEPGRAAPAEMDVRDRFLQSIRERVQRERGAAARPPSAAAAARDGDSSSSSSDSSDSDVEAFTASQKEAVQAVSQMLSKHPGAQEAMASVRRLYAETWHQHTMRQRQESEEGEEEEEEEEEGEEGEEQSELFSGAEQGEAEVDESLSQLRFQWVGAPDPGVPGSELWRNAPADVTLGAVLQRCERWRGRGALRLLWEDPEGDLVVIRRQRDFADALEWWWGSDREHLTLHVRHL